MTVKSNPNNGDRDRVPKWAFDALLWLGGTIWGLFVVVLGYAYLQIDSRLNRIEDILLHRPSSVALDHPNNLVLSQEKDNDRVRLTTTREKTTSTN